MKGNGFYILVIILFIIYFIPAEVLLQFALVVGLIIAALLGFVIYKFRKAFMKFKQQAQGSNSNDTTDETEAKSDAKVKSIKDDDYDMSKNNIIDTDYEEV